MVPQFLQRTQSNHLFGLPSEKKGCGCNNPWITKRAGRPMAGPTDPAPAPQSDRTAMVVAGVALLGLAVWLMPKQG